MNSQPSFSQFPDGAAPTQPVTTEELQQLLATPGLAEQQPLVARLATALIRQLPPPPERLIQDNVAQQYWLGYSLGIETPALLYARIREDKVMSPYMNPQMYEAQGFDKAALILQGLDQCYQLAQGRLLLASEDHLTLTLRHLYVHLALLVGEYEKQGKPFAA